MAKKSLKQGGRIALCGYGLETKCINGQVRWSLLHSTVGRFLKAGIIRGNNEVDDVQVTVTDGSAYHFSLKTECSFPLQLFKV